MRRGSSPQGDEIFRPLRRTVQALLAGALLTALAIGALFPSWPARAQADQPTDTLLTGAVQADSVAHDSTQTEEGPRLDQTLARLAAQAQAASPETLAAEQAPSVPVFLGGKEIFRARVGRDGLDPSSRAGAIRGRLTAAVRDLALPADSVRLISTPQGVEVRLGPRFLWLMTPGDVEGSGPADLASQIADLPERLRQGIEKERAGRRPVGIIISVLMAVLLTIAAWIAARLLLSGSRRWRAVLRRSLPRYLKGVRFRGFEVLSQSQLTGAVGEILARLDVVVGLLLLYAYVTLVLSLFPWTQGWSWRLFHFAAMRLLGVAAGFAEAIPGLLVIAVILIAFRWLAGLSDRFFEAIGTGALTLGGFHSELARPSKRLVRVVLWIVAVMVAYPYIPGSHSRAVQGVTLLLGVMVSLGSTGFVGNVISGIVLTYSRSFRTGDRVRIADHVGDVTSLGFFATKLRSIRNEEITLPNGQVASAAIINYTRLAEEQGLVLHTEVTIGYDADWRRVHELMVEAATRVPGIEKEPRPWVFQRSLNDFHVSYELNAVTRDSHAQLRLYSELHQEIQDAFARAGVEILSPGYTAIRDGHARALPQEPQGPRAAPGAFRVSSTTDRS